MANDKMIRQDYMTFELLSKKSKGQKTIKVMQMLLLKLYFGQKPKKNTSFCPKYFRAKQLVWTDI